MEFITNSVCCLVIKIFENRKIFLNDVCLNYNKKSTNKSVNLIEKVKSDILTRCLSDSISSEKIDLKDFHLNFSWIIKLFIEKHGTNSTDKIIKTLEWRKSFEVSQRDDSYFPSEIFQVGVLFPYKHDKQGNQLLILRICVHQKVADLNKLMQQFFIHQIEKMCKSSLPWATIVDFTGCGMHNVDMEMTFFAINALQNHYPRATKYVLLYNMPLIIKVFWSIAKSWVQDDDLFKFAFGNEILNYVDADQLPLFMQGKCNFDYRKPPSGSKPAHLCTHLNFTHEQITNFEYIFREQLNQTLD